MSDIYRDRPPLWQVMDQATMRPFSSCSERYAWELRAIAEEANEQFACFTDTSGRIVGETFVNWLLAEAEKAEAKP